MTQYINTVVLDSGLTTIQTLVTTTYITYTQQATTYTQASSTYACANATATMTGPANGSFTDSRKLSNPAISSGSVTATQTAGWYALTSGTVLYFANALNATQPLTSGNTFSLATFDCTIRGDQ